MTSQILELCFILGEGQNYVEQCDLVSGDLSVFIIIYLLNRRISFVLFVCCCLFYSSHPSSISSI